MRAPPGRAGRTRFGPDRSAPERSGTATSARAFRLLRLLPLVVLAAVAVALAASGWHRELSMEGLIRRHAAVDALVTGQTGAAFAAFVAVYMAAAALAVPGTAGLSVIGGLLFGPLAGTAGTLVAATTGAAVLFLVARTALGDRLIRLGGRRAVRLTRGLRRNAFGNLLVMRLVPVVPFWLVNIVAGIAGVPLRPFVAATLIGIAPATIAYTVVGAGLDSAIRTQAARHAACLAAGDDCRVSVDLATVLTPELLAALAALGLLALIPLAVRRWRAARGDRSSAAGSGPP